MSKARRVRIWPLAAALTLHAGAFVLLMWRLGSERGAPVEEVMRVALVPPLPARTPERPTIAAAAAGRSASHVRAQAPPSSALAAAAPDRVGAPAAQAETVAPVLRGLLGCERLGDSTAAELRERCAQQLAKGRDPTQRPLSIDPTGRMAADAVPYLARRPKNGCKLMAGGTRDPAGKEGAAFGFGCAWQF